MLYMKFSSGSDAVHHGEVSGHRGDTATRFSTSLNDLLCRSTVCMWQFASLNQFMDVHQNGEYDRYNAVLICHCNRSAPA